MSDETNTTAWITRGWSHRGKKYHTDKECPSFNRCGNVRETTEQAAQDLGLELCGNCHRTWKDSEYDGSYQAALKKHAESD